MANPGRRRLPWLVDEVLRTGRLPDSFVGALLSQFQLTGPDRTSLLTDLLKGGGVHAFRGRPRAKASPVLGLAQHTLLGVDRNGGAHILHSLFSVLFGTYDPNWRYFGGCGELPPEGLPAITDIPVASFGSLRDFSAVSREDHRVHLEGFPPSGWQTTSCERASNKEEG